MRRKRYKQTLSQFTSLVITQTSFLFLRLCRMCNERFEPSNRWEEPLVQGMPFNLPPNSCMEIRPRVISNQGGTTDAQGDSRWTGDNRCTAVQQMNRSTTDTQGYHRCIGGQQMRHFQVQHSTWTNGLTGPFNDHHSPTQTREKRKISEIQGYYPELTRNKTSLLWSYLR